MLNKFTVVVYTPNRANYVQHVQQTVTRAKAFAVANAQAKLNPGSKIEICKNVFFESHKLIKTIYA
jgi:hypothetical protein